MILRTEETAAKGTTCLYMHKPFRQSTSYGLVCGFMIEKRIYLKQDDIDKKDFTDKADASNGSEYAIGEKEDQFDGTDLPLPRPLKSP